MSSWKFNPEELTILNLSHGQWAIDLKEITTERELLHWILQAGKHDFNMFELFEEFRKAISHCFGGDGVNGATMLQFLFETDSIGVSSIDWMTGRVVPNNDPE